MWVPHDTRDQVMDFVNYWSKRSGIYTSRFIRWLGIGASKFYDWRRRYGKINEHNAWIPRDFWLEDWEKQAIVNFFLLHPGEGYRRLTFMMLDAGVVAVSPSSVYRVLSAGGYLNKWNKGPSTKGHGFKGPKKPHEHWHIDISYLNIRGTFYYMCAILDGYSRYIVHWEIRAAMTEADVEIILQRAKEKFPNEKARIISDNGPQFIAKDFKEFIRISGMEHVRTSPCYPQSNGKIERWHQSLKRECIRPKCPLSLEEARRIVDGFVDYYNTKRLHSSIGFISPKDKLEGREKEIFAERDRKLHDAGELRKIRRRKQREVVKEQLNVVSNYGYFGCLYLVLLREEQSLIARTKQEAGLKRLSAMYAQAGAR
jgi:transposase InsO family protein